MDIPGVAQLFDEIDSKFFAAFINFVKSAYFFFFMIN